MKLLYKPFAVIAGVIGAKIGRSVFKAMWARLDTAEPPEPTHREASTGKVVAAAALEAAALSAAKAVTTRASARSFHYLTGFWPGEKQPEEKDKEKRA
jgi:hypothetical protein